MRYTSRSLSDGRTTNDVLSENGHRQKQSYVFWFCPAPFRNGHGSHLYRSIGEGVYVTLQCKFVSLHLLHFSRYSLKTPSFSQNIETNGHGTFSWRLNNIIVLKIPLCILRLLSSRTDLECLQSFMVSLSDFAKYVRSLNNFNYKDAVYK